MANGQGYGGKLQWIAAYHEGDSSNQGASGSGADMIGNCTRCGKVLPNHEAQDQHNSQAHL